MKTNYSEHALYWDWDEYDDSETYDFWCKLGNKYGANFLNGMCAIGKAAAYIAKKGNSVTDIDYTDEMINEGKKRFGDMKNLQFVRADICDFELSEKNVDFFFITGSDIHLLPSIEVISKALKNIHNHLKTGGGLGIELWYPLGESWSAPLKRFDPRVPRKDGIYIWKESEASYDATSKRQDIHQIIHIESDGETKSFDHYVSLQMYEKEALLFTFQNCGFEIVGEYCDYNFKKSENPYENCFIELKRK